LTTWISLGANSKKDRDWILFTDEQPTVPVACAGYTRRDKAGAEAEGRTELPGTFTGARKCRRTFATQSAMMKRRVAQFLSSTDCRYVAASG
jgi:excinuclease ABC subunit A